MKSPLIYGITSYECVNNFKNSWHTLGTDRASWNRRSCLITPESYSNWNKQLILISLPIQKSILKINFKNLFKKINFKCSPAIPRSKDIYTEENFLILALPLPQNLIQNIPKIIYKIERIVMLAKNNLIDWFYFSNLNLNMLI